ncbi:MAG TPA: universal stress protein [Sphingomicrobium sp.]|nr:universal stress protein [Sphingomicrobium sp.]
MRQQSQPGLVMDRPETASLSQQVAGSGIKSILFHVHEDDTLMDRLQLVLSLARACSAHVHCLHVTPIEAYTVVDSFGGTFVNQEIVEAFEEQAAKLQKRIESSLQLEDVTWDYEEVTGALMPHLVHSAALADIVITGREPHEREFGGPAVTLCGDLLAQLRNPLMITGDDPASFDPFGPAVIAWNGSYEAMNAVRAALPLLKMASNVSVVQLSEERDRRFPSTKLLEYLSRHGISANLETHTTSGEISDALVRCARADGAGIIVMGAYGHNRAGEFLFGGVTRALLKQCPMTLVMAR